jgi:hypothetical protein
MSAEFNFERAKYYDEINRRAAERWHDRDEALFRSLNDAAMRDAQAAIRLLLAFNGGLAAALLAFTGGLVGRTNIPLPAIGQMAANLKWFAYGLVTAGVAAAASYFTNLCYAAAASARPRSWTPPYVLNTPKDRRRVKAAYVFHVIGVVCAMISLGLFIYGLYKVQQRLGPLFAQVTSDGGR